MVKRFIIIMINLFLIISLSGCWNYRGLNEMTIVAGIAIDKKPENNNYLLSFEIVDTTMSIKERGPNSKIIESEGKTLFDAVRNAKKRVANKLYFGHTEIVIISEEIARNDDLNNIIDWFLRDNECRETICFVISQEKSARDLLSIRGLGQNIKAIEIKKIVVNDKKITSSTVCVELYNIYNILKADGKSLTLPAMHNIINDGEPANEVNGIAVFKEKKLIGFLTTEESRYFLFVLDEIKGGVLTFSSNKNTQFALEISKNKTKKSFQVKDGEIKILIKTDTTVYLNESMGYSDSLNKKQIKEMEKIAEKELKKNISSVVKKVQAEYNSDIFGFGNMIYKKNFKLWNHIKDKWEDEFMSLNVEIQSDIHIINTASIKES